MAKNGPNDPKWSRVAQSGVNGPKCPRVAQMAQNGPSGTDGTKWTKPGNVSFPKMVELYKILYVLGLSERNYNLQFLLITLYLFNVVNCVV